MKIFIGNRCAYDYKICKTLINLIIVILQDYWVEKGYPRELDGEWKYVLSTDMVIAFLKHKAEQVIIYCP